MSGQSDGARPRYPKMLRFGMVETPSGRGSSKSIVIYTAQDRQRFTMVCVCHLKRDQAGQCVHIRAIWPAIKPWYQARTTIEQPEARP